MDGTGAPGEVVSLGIRDGKVVAVTKDPTEQFVGKEIIEATGKWVLPGFVDIHTHYDAEVLFDPGLRESVRHGVTTVLLGCCSMSTIYAESEDLADTFSRVEAVPREFVAGVLAERREWTTAEQYIAALEKLPLGPNVSSFIGHSDLRAAVLGLGRATDGAVRPSKNEQKKMESLLRQALRAGMVGMSGMDAPLDKLDGDRFRSRALPSTYAKWKERRKLIEVIREENHVLQSAPNPKTFVSI